MMGTREQLERARAREIWRTYVVNQDRKQVVALVKATKWLNPHKVMDYVRAMEKGEIE